MNSLLHYCPLILLLALGVSCREAPSENNVTDVNANGDLEAREDSLALVAAYARQDRIQQVVHPDVETKAIHAQSEEDAADDPAIWVHPTDVSKSLIYGSNKKGGLASYNLSGEEVAYYPIGNVNNVDVLDQFILGKTQVPVLGCSNRSHQSIDLFRIDVPTGVLKPVTKDTLFTDPKLIDDIYGFCFARDRKTGTTYCVINAKNGLVQQYRMVDKAGNIDLELMRSIQMDSQPEGMVADEELGYLYIGEEGRGIWKVAIDPNAGSKKSFIEGSDDSNPNISYDIEGLSIYKDGATGYLVASSQGNFSYAVFERQGDNRYVGSFKIVDGNGIDGVEETDGLDMVRDSLSPLYPKGLLVVQDGFNRHGKTMVPQNFKLISMEKVLEVMGKRRDGGTGG